MTTRLFSVATTLDGAPVLCEGRVVGSIAVIESITLDVLSLRDTSQAIVTLDLIDYLTPDTLDALRDKCEAQLEGSEEMQKERFR